MMARDKYVAGRSSRRWILLFGGLFWISACTSDPAYKGTVRSEYSKADYQRFLDESNKLIALNPKDDGAYAERGFAYDGLGEYEKAVADLTQAIALNDHMALYWGERGYAYYKLGDYRHAIDDSSKSVSLDPKNMPAYVNRADSYALRSHCDAFSRNLDDCQAAIADYRRALALAPNHEWVRNTLNRLGG